MKDSTWTWIDKYRTWFRPTLPQICKNCGYEGYFKLKEIKVPTPSWPFFEVCPECGNQVECNGVEAKSTEELEELAKRLGKTPQELYNETFKNLIMEFNHKTGKVRIVRK